MRQCIPFCCSLEELSLTAARQDGLKQVHRDREKRRGVPLRRDLAHRLQIPELDRHGVTRKHLSGLGKLRGGLELAFSADDLRAALALGLGLLGHRALHVLGKIHLLDLDRRYLDAPGLGALVDDALELLVDLVPR
jgi:hypothetical protein